LTSVGPGREAQLAIERIEARIGKPCVTSTRALL
jgi:hypothetical protein